MPLHAITRNVSPRIGRCELTFHHRASIDLAKARNEHETYEQCLTDLGTRVISLPAEPEYPDSVFVEDAALVLDEVAIIPIMGAPSRRGETATLAAALSDFRRIEHLVAAATMDGGDVLHVGPRLFIGMTQRTNREAADQVRDILRPFGYTVEPVAVRNILHLKSACSTLGENVLLVNRDHIDVKPFKDFKLIDVPVN